MSHIPAAAHIFFQFPSKEVPPLAEELGPHKAMIGPHKAMIDLPNYRVVSFILHFTKIAFLFELIIVYILMTM